MPKHHSQAAVAMMQKWQRLPKQGCKELAWAEAACAAAGVHSVLQEDSGAELRDAVPVADAEQQDQHHWPCCAECASHVAGKSRPFQFLVSCCVYAVVLQEKICCDGPCGNEAETWSVHACDAAAACGRALSLGVVDICEILITSSCPRRKLCLAQPLAYMCVHIALTTMTFALCKLWWASYVAHTTFLLFIFAISAWNGAALSLLCMRPT